MKLDERVGQQLHGPDGASLGRLAAGERDERRLALRVELRRAAGPGPVVQRAVEAVFEPRLGEAPPHALHRVHARVQRPGGVIVECVFARAQQDVGAEHGPGGRPALARQQEQACAVLLTQVDPILLRPHAVLAVGWTHGAPNESRHRRGPPPGDNPRLPLDAHSRPALRPRLSERAASSRQTSAPRLNLGVEAVGNARGESCAWPCGEVERTASRGIHDRHRAKVRGLPLAAVGDTQPGLSYSCVRRLATFNM
jgi:hypothetical protein